MKPTFSQIVHEALHTPRPTTKRIERVRAAWKRDRRGRFVKLIRKAYTRRIKNYEVRKSAVEQMADNIASNNTILSALMKKGAYRAK